MRGIIHIGPPKTGTTTIQEFLAANRARLRAAGIYVPATKVDNHREFRLAVASAVKTGTRAMTGWQSAIEAGHGRLRDELSASARGWLAEAASSDCSAFLISSEGFAGLSSEEIGRLRDLMAPFCDDGFTVVAFLRRQDLHLNSRMKTSVKLRGRSTEVNLRGINYSELLGRWASVFGESSIKTEIFADSRPDRERVDLIEAFVRTAGLPLTNFDRFKMPERRNTAWDYRALSIAAAVNPLLPPLSGGKVSRERRIVERALTDAFPNPHPFRMPKHQAQELYERFAESNVAVARQWFNRDQLFHDDFSMYEDGPRKEASVGDCAQVMVWIAELTVSAAAKDPDLVPSSYLPPMTSARDLIESVTVSTFAADSESGDASDVPRPPVSLHDCARVIVALAEVAASVGAHRMVHSGQPSKAPRRRRQRRSRPSTPSATVPRNKSLH